jgi:cytochrome c oxidase subunit 4
MSTTVPKRVYFMVWGALLALLLLTWGLAEIDLGAFNNVAALSIAVAKMSLVIFFFMHVGYEKKALTWVFVAAGFFWFAIMVTFSISDYLTRGPSWHH